MTDLHPAPGIATATGGRMWAPLIFSVLYGLALAMLPMDALMDRANYIEYAAYSDEKILLNASQGLLVLIFNEPLWLLLNVFLANFFSDAEGVIRFYIFFSSSIFSYFFVRRNFCNAILFVAIIFAPIIIKNYVIHLRQGVAISVFFLGWCIANRRIRLGLMLLSPFIHASFFFVIFLMFVSRVLQKLRFSVVLLVSAFCAIALGMMILAPKVAQIMGARQVDALDSPGGDVSGFGFVFWVAVAMVFAAQGQAFIKKHLFEIFSLLFYLISYFFLPWSGRIFESALCVILSASISLTGWRRSFFFFMMIGYVLLMYSMRINRPMLGFGF